MAPAMDGLFGLRQDQQVDSRAAGQANVDQWRTRADAQRFRLAAGDHAPRFAGNRGLGAAARKRSAPVSGLTHAHQRTGATRRAAFDCGEHDQRRAFTARGGVLQVGQDGEGCRHAAGLAAQLAGLKGSRKFTSGRR